MKKSMRCKSKFCRKEITDADFAKCPHCGQTYPGTRMDELAQGIFGLLLIVLVVVVIF